MESVGFLVVAAGLLAFGLVSKQLERSILTPPMAFIGFGLLIGSSGLGLAHLDLGHGVIHALAEVTLILVLFSDAARIDLALLRRDHDLPVRMLAIGLPLTILIGTLVGLALLPGISGWEAVLLAAILAPTDAALGQAVVSSPLVPARIRQALNVESGLNDGIALPVVLILASLAANMGASNESAAHWLRLAGLQVTLGPLVGAVVGWAGGRLIDGAAQRGWMTSAFEGISALSVAFVAYALATLVGGNGFIAAFASGLVFGNTVRHRCAFLFEFGEAEGQLLSLATFMIFGAAMLPLAAEGLNLRVVGYAALSLTLVRMVPVSISLIGTRVTWPTHLFLGWFGPRGLASILFALLILERTAIVHRETLLVITIVTVASSAMLHGATAAAAVRWFASIMDPKSDHAEHRPVAEMPTRLGASVSEVPGRLDRNA